MDNNFIEVWREAYGKMITDTIKAIALAEEQYVKPYIISSMENPCLLVRFGAFLDKHVARVSDEQMKEWDKDTEWVLYGCGIEAERFFYENKSAEIEYIICKNHRISNFLEYNVYESDFQGLRRRNRTYR